MQQKTSYNYTLIFETKKLFLYNHIFVVPSGTVQEILLEDNNFTSITISWQPVVCLQQNSPVTSYKVRYTETSITTGPLSTTDTSFVATSLFYGTSYTFEIAAVNKDGVGPYQQFIASTDHHAGIFL